MRMGMVIPVAMFLGGIASVAAAVATGEADVSLVLIFPVFSGSGPLFLLGVLLIVASFIAGFVLLTREQVDELSSNAPQNEPVLDTPQNRKTQFGGVVLIGPVPIAFGSDKKTALIMLVIGIVAAVLMLGLILAL